MSGTDSVFLALLASLAVTFALTWARVVWFS
jgi:hypothetical protein